MKNSHEIFCVAKKGVCRLYLVYLVLPDKLSNKLLYNVNRHFEYQLVENSTYLMGVSKVNCIPGYFERYTLCIEAHEYIFLVWWLRLNS